VRVKTLIAQEIVWDCAILKQISISLVLAESYSNWQLKNGKKIYWQLTNTQKFNWQLAFAVSSTDNLQQALAIVIHLKFIENKNFWLKQGKMKRLPDSPGLVKQSVGLALSYPRLPDGQAWSGHEWNNFFWFVLFS